ncbi:MAG: eukaryotic-like serine/threonine-protein kinase [Myxococcales bacterium]|nr:eukaryotic-like serine/threonine-protein kinase [Myxococcales bacterium]
MSEIRFGSYRVVEALGSGAISTIYRAVQEPLGRIVALKALKTQISPTSSFGEQLDREAKILRDLAHPNVVLLLDVARTASGRPFLVLENVEGPSLHQLLAKKRILGVDAALAVGCGICAALEHVHERGVVHRDVKPSNVLLTNNGVVKMIDFGIAQRARTPTLSDTFGAEGITPSGRIAPEAVKDAFGTPAYMSPEQILGDFVDGRSDLFSLGVVLYQMLSGSRPFEAEAPAKGAAAAAADRSAAQRIRRDVPAPLRERAPHVPRAVERIVMRLLEKAPSERYGSASDVLERLQRELRTLTRDDPASVVRSTLVETGFATGETRALGTGMTSPRRALDAKRVIAGHVLVLIAFIVGVFAIEGGSFARGGTEAGKRPLELVPGEAGGLRVLATPWAHVRVDGQQVETTPFARAIPLAPGKHWITLTHPEAPPVEREISVATGEIVTLDVTMSVGSVEDAGKNAR